jgi:L,D-peptidoglycan transpeptidase YkuD (ErfK/YbiS/YcfS/YnhG family)
MIFNSFKKSITGLFLFSMMSTVSAMDLIVKSNGTAKFNEKIYHCALGKNGVTSHKIEGDLKTPMGKFPLRCVYYRPDKFLEGIHTGLLKKPSCPTLGWCDDPASPFYNQAIHLPFSGSYESLWRKDDIYDLVIVVGYNDHPVHRGKGSAIFIHIAGPHYRPTLGCIAFSRKDLLEILEGVDKKSCIIIQ